RAHPTYMHSFALTPRYVVLTEHPFLARLAALATMGLTSRPIIDVFSWRSDLPTTFFVIERATGRRVGEYATEAFFVFHHANAFEQAGKIAVDVVAYASPSIVDEMYFDYVRGPMGGRISRAECRRY